MEKAQLREKVESLLNDLPEDADWNDLMYKIYVRQSIEQGLKDAEEGRIKSQIDILSIIHEARNLSEDPDKKK